ncbi:MAG: hypothetical protein JNK46_09475 [Methylobacteriaceae bacterium]|nr:hypothetical protein [Methylobacteriaceae bacterium]
MSKFAAADHAAAMRDALADAHADGIAHGRAAERARIDAILSHPEAVGRYRSAVALAIETDLSAEQAGKVLTSLPREEGPDDQLAALLGTPVASPSATAARALNDYERLTGRQGKRES